MARIARITPRKRAVRANATPLADCQRTPEQQGVLLAWPRFGALTPLHRTGYRHDGNDGN